MAERSIQTKGRVSMTLGSSDPRNRRNAQAEQAVQLTYGDGLTVAGSRLVVDIDPNYLAFENGRLTLAPAIRAALGI